MVSRRRTHFPRLCHKCKVLELSQDLLRDSALGKSETESEWEIALNWEMEEPGTSGISRRAMMVSCDFCEYLSQVFGSHSMSSNLRGYRDQGIRLLLCYVLRRAGDDRLVLESLRIKVLTDQDGSRALVVDCPIARASSGSRHSSIDLREPCTHLDPEPLDWIKAQLELCTEHCHTQTQKTFVPDRLIRIGKDADDLRLILTKDASSSHFNPPRYAALTYCWGPPPHADKQLKTTESNLGDHLEAIPPDRLPRVVGDAVSATRALGIKYLWVDAICILQDVAWDWDYQCTQMVNIYSNAYVTICSASSSNCEEGFVQRKDQTVTLPLHSPSGPPTRFDIYAPSLYSTHNDLFRTEWKSRGWTFQERMASTRMLMFGPTNVHFECRDYCSSMGVSQEASYFRKINRDVLHQGDAALIYKEWNAKVASEFTFSRLSFTYPTDILPSMAGIATLFSYHLNDEYLAGLWRKGLYRSLTWSIWRSDATVSYTYLLKRLENPPLYIAPSWSWVANGRSNTVSCEVDVTELTENARSEFTLVDAVVSLKGTSPFGELTSGHLDIRGNCFAASMDLAHVRRGLKGTAPRQTLRFHDQYLMDIEPDCLVDDLFDDQGKPAVPISFLLIGSTINVRQDRSDWHPLSGQENKPDNPTELFEETDLVLPEPESPVRAYEVSTPTFGEYHSMEVEADIRPSTPNSPLSTFDAARPTLTRRNSMEPDTPTFADNPTPTIPDRDQEEFGSNGRRLAYGLVIHPTRKPGEFYRVGVFTSWAYQLGGLEFFQSCEIKDVRLV
ncbi:hypothetical protein F66182_7931 [Fusarium sp. NRRL 66182]|nr:hypothetical protein F66182_7931 [Fusarium sp. NRRL 66182]